MPSRKRRDFGSCQFGGQVWVVCDDETNFCTRVMNLWVGRVEVAPSVRVTWAAGEQDTSQSTKNPDTRTGTPQRHPPPATNPPSRDQTSRITRFNRKFSNSSPPTKSRFAPITARGIPSAPGPRRGDRPCDRLEALGPVQRWLTRPAEHFAAADQRWCQSDVLASFTDRPRLEQPVVPYAFELIGIGDRHREDLAAPVRRYLE